MKINIITAYLLFIGAYIMPFLGQADTQTTCLDTVFLNNDGSYYQIPPTSVNHLSVGDVLAVPYLKSDVVSAEVVEENLPQGLSLFPNGLIVVTQADKLKVGKYTLDIKTTDTQGSEVNTTLLFEITQPVDRADKAASYRLGGITIISELSRGEVLAEPVDKDGSIKVARRIMGNLPPGTQLTPEGKIIVSDRELLKANTYSTGVVTMDQLGGVTFLMVTISLEDKEGAH